MYGNDFAAGASAARNKLAAYLREHGIPVPYTWHPPADEDFLQAIRVAIRAAQSRSGRAITPHELVYEGR